jgi:hypothetical protein
LNSLIEERGPDRLLFEPTFTEVGDKLVGRTAWTDPQGTRHERHAVLTIRDGKIADMQVCGSWRQAKRFANRARL